MKYRILTTAIAAIVLATTPAIAKDKHKHKHKNGKHDVVLVDRNHRGDRIIVVDDDRFDRRGNNPKAQGRHDNGLHLGWYKQRWQRGERIPVAYLEPRYYVDDYRTYGLAPPPSGYRWVRPMDERYLLVQVATGLVLEALGY